MADGDRNSVIEGIIYTKDALIESFRNSEQGIIIFGLIVIIVTIYTVARAYNKLTGWLGL